MSARKQSGQEFSDDFEIAKPLFTDLKGIFSIFARFGAAVAKAPLFWALLAGILAIVLIDRDSWILFSGIAVIAVAAIALKTTRKSAILALVALALFSVRHFERLSEIRKFPLATMLEKSEDVEIAGEAWISNRPERNGNSLSVMVTISRIGLPSGSVRCDHEVPTWIQGNPSPLAFGDVVGFTGLLKPLEAPLSPGGFDPEEFYFRNNGSLARLEIRPGDRLEIQQVPKRGAPLVHLAHRARDWMEKALRHGLAENDDRFARVILAMALGARENSPEDLEDLFRLSGTMHIFAVSGLHVGIITLLLLGIFRILGVSTRISICIVIPMILFYALMTGFRPSAVRAALMASVFLSGFLFLEKPRLLNSLGLAGILLLLHDSQQIFLPGFQLSFAVLLSISLLTEPLRERLLAPFTIDPFLPRSLVSARRMMADRLAFVTAAALAISAVSWLGSAPLLMWHFQGISLIGILANMVMIPLAGMIVSLAAASVLFFGIKFSWVTALLNKVNIGLTVLLTTSANFFASVPGSYTHTGSDFSQNQLRSPFELTVMGRRGGCASLLTWRDGAEAKEQNWLIDTGGESTYRQQILPLLRSRGINHLDGLVLSHGDMAHIGAAPEVISRFNPDVLIESPLKNRSRIYPKILAVSQERKKPTLQVHAGQVLGLGEHLECRILFPEEDTSLSLADDRTLVLLFATPSLRILFTFDAGFEVQKRLLEKGVDLQADVWIRGQHTRTNTNAPRFLEAVGPRAVISTNAEFPAHERISPTFLNSMRKGKIDFFDLGKTGAVRVSVDDGVLHIKPFLEAVASRAYRLE